jgi:hypothetical protein
VFCVLWLCLFVSFRLFRFVSFVCLFVLLLFLTFSCTHPDAPYLPIIQFHANFIANYKADQAPTNLPLLSTADYAMPTYFSNCLFFVCSVLLLLTLVVNFPLCCYQVANALRITMDYRLCDDLLQLANACLITMDYRLYDSYVCQQLFVFCLFCTAFAYF